MVARLRKSCSEREGERNFFTMKRKAVLTRAEHGDWTEVMSSENSEWLRGRGTEGGDEVGDLAHSF